MKASVWFFLGAVVACRDGAAAPATVAVPIPSSAPVASVEPAAVDAGPGPARDEAFDLVRKPPRRVGELLAALGLPVTAVWESSQKSGMGNAVVTAPSDGVRFLSVNYPWDLYHSRPVASASAFAERALASWMARFPVERRSACVAALSRLGAPVPKKDPDGTTWEQYGELFLGPIDGAAFALEWFASTPDWAKPEIDAATRKKAVKDLARAVTAAQTDDELAKATVTNAAAGITSKGSLNPHDEWIEFEPPMLARDFASAIGYPGLAGRSVGVHMSSWQLVKVTGTTVLDPTLGVWEVEAAVDGRPSGSRLTQFQPGPTAYYALGPNDLVRHVRFKHP